MTKIVRDVMHPGVITCQPEAILGEVAVLLTQHHVHALIVIDRDGRPLGIISDYDLLAGEWLSVDAESLDAMRKLTANDLMSFPVDTIDANMNLKKAAQKLIDEDVNRLLVTDNGTPVGVISISDFVSSLAKEGKSRRETVADVMSDAIMVCRGKTPIISAARSMTDAGWRSVLVVDAKGKHLGVVSGKDLVNFVVKGVDESMTVADVMHPALTVHINTSLREAANLMIQKHFHRLIVIDGDDPDAFPLGIISSYDIVAEMARPDSIWQK